MQKMSTSLLSAATAACLLEFSTVSDTNLNENRSGVCVVRTTIYRIESLIWFMKSVGASNAPWEAFIF